MSDTEQPTPTWEVLVHEVSTYRVAVEAATYEEAMRAAKQARQDGRGHKVSGPRRTTVSLHRRGQVSR